MQPTIKIVQGDVATIPVDVLVLKYAQEYYGADRHVASLLAQAGQEESTIQPRSGGYRLVSGHGAISATNVLFVGVAPLREFGYGEIRDFSRRALAALAGEAPSTRSIAATVHGPGYGLDEVEALKSELAGFLDGIQSGDCPEKLESISIVERNRGRANRLSYVVDAILPPGPQGNSTEALVVDFAAARQERLRSVGHESEAKAHVFVAMPFRDDMEDLYHYGIQSAVHGAGFLCERADLSSFTGDVLSWVKSRIASAALLIADLSGANPNVYLEVGYAWGRGIPTVLVTSDTKELKFDIQGQRCLAYSSIRNLEAALRSELQSLRDAGMLAQS